MSRDRTREQVRTEDATRAAAHRLRRRYRALLREQVERTLDDPADLSQELAAVEDNR